MAAIKITAADRWFSLCVRERACWRCEKSGKQYPEKSSALHCSHTIPRRNKAVRWDGLNATALSFACHKYWWHAHPIEAAEWMKQKLGTALYEVLREKGAQVYRLAKGEEKAIAAHYREQYAEMRQKRMDGVTGRIEFVSWQREQT